MASAIKKPAIPGPGLKKQGVVLLQSLFLFILVGLEMWIRDGAGILSGLAICLVTYGGVAYGRTGTRYVSAVTPPLVLGAVISIYFLIADGLAISRLGIDILAALASVGPWMLAAAVYGWFMFLNEKAKSRKPKPRI